MRRSAAGLFDALHSTLLARRDHGRKIIPFFFVRKPPDVRVRFRTPSWAATYEIAALFERLHAQGVVGAWDIGPYEPESELLGGASLVDATHRYFCVDTRAWMLLERGASRAKASQAVLSMAIMNDLFFTALSADEEVWDVWCNLCVAHQVAPTHERDGALVTIEELFDHLSATERRAVRLYKAANRRFVQALERSSSRGRLRYGIRSILPYIALFHWNRFGLPREQRTAILRTMTGTLDPRRNLQGRQVDRPPATREGVPTTTQQR